MLSVQKWCWLDGVKYHYAKHPRNGRGPIISAEVLFSACVRRLVDAIVKE